MNSFELAAASNFLSYFPDEIAYSTLINRLNNDRLGEGNDAIEFWQPFEYYPSVFISECIESLHQTLIRTFEVKK